MRNLRKVELFGSVVLGCLLAVAASCRFNPNAPLGTSGHGGGSGSGGPGGSGKGGSGPSDAGMPATACQGLQCQQSTCRVGSCAVPACAGDARTTVSGTVYDPAGNNPLANITVFVPNKPLDPIADGPSCDPCDAKTGTALVSGQPVAITTTDAKGRFTLGMGPMGGDVPAGANIPLVIQVGKWRRQVTIDNVMPCEQKELTDKNLTRLPRDQSEGHIPKIALTTGGSDALECLLRKVGIADTEFTPEAASGRVNFYGGGGGTASYDTTLNAGAAFTPVHTAGAADWWDSFDNLSKYDIVLHSCEGGDGQFQGQQQPRSTKSAAAHQALEKYANMGGRVFASHWHVNWFEQGPASFQSIGTFNHRTGLPDPYDATIDTGFSTGKTLADWMVNVGGSTTPGMVSIHQNASQRTVDSVAGGTTSQRWIYASTLNPPSVIYLSATTPIPGGTCGRVVFSDLHVSAGGTTDTDQPNKPFPTGCVTTTLSPQEKVLEFMLFDIASCVAPIVP